MIPIARPSFGEEELAAVCETIQSGWVTQGPKVAEFEQLFAAYAGSAYACAVSNCTSALHLALLSVGVGLGDVVVTVSHSFIATANSVRACGAEPVFVDIDLNTYNIDPKSLETFLENRCSKVNEKLFYNYTQELAVGQSPLRCSCREDKQSSNKFGRIAAILAVDQMGIPCALETITEIAKRYDIPVIEDAACAIGSERKNSKNEWDRVGLPICDICCFSFHPRKILVTGDGGMLTTNSKAFDRKFRLLRQHGMGVSDYNRHSSSGIVIEQYKVTGFNYRLTDVQAAIGVEQIKKLNVFIERRCTIANIYQKLLKKIPWVKYFEPPQNIRPNWQSFPIFLLPDAPRTRDELMSYLYTKGISTRPGIMNAHLEEPYQAQNWKLPLSEKARERTVLLPLFHDILEDEIKQVVAALMSA